MPYFVQAKNSGNYLRFSSNGYSWTPHLEDATRFLDGEIAKDRVRERTELKMDELVVFYLS